MNKYFKSFLLVLIVSTSIMSCGNYYEQEVFTDFSVAGVYGNEVLLIWDSYYYHYYGFYKETVCISTSQNPTINSANTVWVDANNKINRSSGWWICYNENGYHLHDLYADDAFEPGNDPFFCKKHNYNGIEFSTYSGQRFAVVEDLTPYTTYYARVYTVIDEKKEAYSKQISFTTNK